jgi:serine protease Do
MISTQSLRSARRTLPIPILALALALAGATGCKRLGARHEGRDEPAKTAASTSSVALPGVPAPFATPPVLPGTPDVATLVAKVKPSVVNITTLHELRAPHPAMGPDPFGLFGGRFGRGGGPRDPHGGGVHPGMPRDHVMRQESLGSGFLLDAKGHVITNAHVVEGADAVKVKLADDREFDAQVVGRDARLDLAVLQLEGGKDDLPAAALGQSEALRVGEYVVAIGNPFGLGHTVTMGIVSAKGRSIGAGPYDDFIQTDASINPGNSGGPLFDLQGRVVGINTAINPNGRGIGFAIPIDMLKDVLPQLLDKGHVERGRLGVAFRPVDAATAKAIGLDRAKGALVGEVERGGPADQAGLESGDLITAVDGKEVAHAEELPRMIALHPPGTKLKLDVLRGGKKRSFEVTLGKLAEAKPQPAEDDDQE